MSDVESQERIEIHQQKMLALWRSEWLWGLSSLYLAMVGRSTGE